MFSNFSGKDLVAAPAERLKEAGIALFCIGIEPDSETPQEIETMREELTTIASEPTKQHVFMSDGYRELQRKVHSVSQAACVGRCSFLIFFPLLEKKQTNNYKIIVPLVKTFSKLLALVCHFYLSQKQDWIYYNAQCYTKRHTKEIT